MATIRYVVPGKPCGINATHAGGPKRPFRKSDEARSYALALAAHGYRARQKAGVATTRAEVDVLITFYFESERPDGDGPVKAVLDSLQTTNARVKRVGAGIVANDRQVRDHHVRRRVDRERPRTEIVVGPAGDVFTLSLLLESEQAAAEVA